jgi:hypothetical protein
MKLVKIFLDNPDELQAPIKIFRPAPAYFQHPAPESPITNLDTIRTWHFVFNKQEETKQMVKNTEPKEIQVDGITYVPKQICAQRDGLKYCIVRREARRIYYWDGAASLSQLSVDGTKAPQNCKFPVAVDTITLTEAIEIIPCTEKARKSITEVSVWER